MALIFLIVVSIYLLACCCSFVYWFALWICSLVVAQSCADIGLRASALVRVARGSCSHDQWLIVTWMHSSSKLRKCIDLEKWSVSATSCFMAAVWMVFFGGDEYSCSWLLCVFLVDCVYHQRRRRSWGCMGFVDYMNLMQLHLNHLLLWNTHRQVLWDIAAAAYQLQPPFLCHNNVLSICWKHLIRWEVQPEASVPWFDGWQLVRHGAASRLLSKQQL